MGVPRLDRSNPTADSGSFRSGGALSQSDPAPRIAITYCPRCQWLLRSAWLAQELLSTFAADLREVALVPGPSGCFIVTVDDVVIWDRVADNGFPEAKQLKQRVRDRIAPGRDLGHNDRVKPLHDERTPP